MKIKGYIGALLELLLFAFVTYTMRQNVLEFQKMGNIIYYWFCFSILTGFWEFIYVTNYDSVASYANRLVKTKKHVWTQMYSLNMVLPSKLARLFYAEYGAYADREYMSTVEGDFWSRLIESSHALLCASFSLMAIMFQLHGYPYHAMIAGSVGMGQQFMNSLLYMGEYFMQCKDKDSVNFNCPAFPLGKMMTGRFFMWVNIFWLLMPAYCIVYFIIDS